MYEWEVRAVDPSFLEMFSYPLLKGNPATVLSDPFSLVITEEIAQKYFGEDEPIGKIITIDRNYQFTVTGILAKMPRNSYFRYNIILPFEFLKQRGYTSESWGNNDITTFVQLQQNASVEQVNKKMTDMFRVHNEGMPDWH